MKALEKKDLQDQKPEKQINQGSKRKKQAACVQDRAGTNILGK